MFVLKAAAIPSGVFPYPNATWNLCYDLDLIAREGVKDEGTYLTIPDTEERFPGKIRGQGLLWIPKTIVELERAPTLEEEKRLALDAPPALRAGDKRPVTLLYPAISAGSPRDPHRSGVDPSPSANWIVLKPGELEERLAAARSEFIEKMHGAGLTPETDKIYHLLAAFSIDHTF